MWANHCANTPQSHILNEIINPTDVSVGKIWFIGEYVQSEEDKQPSSLGLLTMTPFHTYGISLCVGTRKKQKKYPYLASDSTTLSLKDPTSNSSVRPNWCPEWTRLPACCSCINFFIPCAIASWIIVYLFYSVLFYSTLWKDYLLMRTTNFSVNG